MRDRIPVGPGTLYVVSVGFEDAPIGETERYLLALGATEPAQDAFDDPVFCRALLDVVRAGSEIVGLRGTLIGRPGRAFPADLSRDVAVRRLSGEQSNTSVVFDDALVMKYFRRLTEGVNPELEIGRFLTEHTAFRGSPRLAGALEYHDGGSSITLGVAQELVRGARDGWQWLLERLAAGDGALPALGRLGERTAELHLALATPTTDPAFEAETITAADVAGWGDAIRRQVATAQVLAGRPLPDVADVAGALAPLLGRARIRHHGDFHLGQTLTVGDGADFALIDFEGEPLRPLAERRRKHTPLRDVAGMLRSFSYARGAVEKAERPQQPAFERLKPTLRDWEAKTRKAFLDAYAAATAKSGLYESFADVRGLLALAELEKALYELRYEMGNRPEWIDIPLAGLAGMLEEKR